MATEITMPQMGADMQEGTLVRWLKQPGDQVSRGEPIAEIETDKANVELESFVEGVLDRTLVNEGQVIPVGQVMALVRRVDEPAGTRNSSAPESAGAPSPAKPEPATDSAEVKSSVSLRADHVQQAADRSSVAPAVSAVQEQRVPAANGAVGGSPRTRVSPVARSVAEELGVDLTRLHGSGPDGRIMRKDVEQSAAAPPPEANAPAATTAPLSRMRQTIARRMAQSKREAPHYYVTAEVDMTEAMAFRSSLNSAAGEAAHVSVNDLILKGCALVLQRYPAFNASFAEDSLRMNPHINISIAVALPDGLVAPALLDVGSKSLGAIAREARDLAERAKSGDLRANEVNDGTFTVSNLGMYGIESVIPIIQPPQSAILGVGAVQEKPAVRDGQIVIRQLMQLALAADHRVTDGAQGAQFLRELKALLEHPLRLAL